MRFAVLQLFLLGVPLRLCGLQASVGSGNEDRQSGCCQCARTSETLRVMLHVRSVLPSSHPNRNFRQQKVHRSLPSHLNRLVDLQSVS